MIKHTSLRFLYGILHVFRGGGGKKIFSAKVFWAIFQVCYVFMKIYLLKRIRSLGSTSTTGGSSD
jgi:hypothetical protein